VPYYFFMSRPVGTSLFPEMNRASFAEPLNYAPLYLCQESLTKEKRDVRERRDWRDMRGKFEVRGSTFLELRTQNFEHFPTRRAVWSGIDQLSVLDSASSYGFRSTAPEQTSVLPVLFLIRPALCHGNSL
jgi:hypothetical protein